jgi:hypothetical protein
MNPLKAAHMEAGATKAIQELRAAWCQFTDASEEPQRIHGEEAAKGDVLPSLKDEDLRRRLEEATSSVQAALAVGRGRLANGALSPHNEGDR